MKFSLIIPVLGLVPFTVAGVAAGKGPHDTEYNKYCGNGKTQGSITGGDKTYSYFCDSEQPSTHSHPFKVSSVERCAEICSENDDSCDNPVWDKAEGRCWIGKASGSRIEKAGRIVMSNDELSACQADLKKWSPVNPICSTNNMKATEVGGKKFVLTCGLGKAEPPLVQDSDGPARQTGVYTTMEDCLESCTSKSNCTYVTHKPETKTCWHGTGDFFTTPIKEKSGYDCAFAIN